MQETSIHRTKGVFYKTPFFSLLTLKLQTPILTVLTLIHKYKRESL